MACREECGQEEWEGKQEVEEVREAGWGNTGCLHNVDGGGDRDQVGDSAAVKGASHRDHSTV